MPKKIEVEFLPPVTDGHWTILAVDKIYVSVSNRQGTTDRRADITLVPPMGREYRIAFPEYAGAGPQPEGTVTMLHVYDRIYSGMTEIENAISEREQDVQKTF